MKEKQLLTIQMLLLRAHDFVSGGLAYCFGHCGPRDAVLGCSDPVRNALARHLRLCLAMRQRNVQCWTLSRGRHLMLRTRTAAPRRYKSKAGDEMSTSSASVPDQPPPPCVLNGYNPGGWKGN